MSKAAELAALIGSQSALSHRNFIINGAMQVAQRNNSSAVTITGDGVYNTVDRFKARTFGGSGRFSMQQATDTPNNSFTNSLKLVVTTTDTSGTHGYAIEHVVEDNVIAAAGLGDSDARPVTLSFWVKSSVTGSYSASLRGNYNTGTPANVQEYSISSADTWEHKEISFPAYTSGLTLTHLLVDFGLGKQTSKTTSTLGTWQTTNFVFGSNQVDWQSNSGATFYLTGVQLELGEQATPFEYRSFADECERCKRYYQKSYVDGVAAGTVTQTGCNMNAVPTSGNTWRYTHDFYHQMRATPTFTFYVPDTGTSGSGGFEGAGDTNKEAISVAFSSNKSAVYFSTSMDQTGFFMWHYELNAEL